MENIGIKVLKFDWIRIFIILFLVLVKVSMILSNLPIGLKKKYLNM